MISKEEVENIIKMKINPDNLYLYQRALIHKSISRNEPNDSPLAYSNERLETLGDSILGAVVMEYLFHKYPKKNEGSLTKYRTRIVRGTTLSEFAIKAGLKGKILMTDQVKKMDGLDNPRILEDAFEAFVGAIFLDQKYEGAKHFLINFIEEHLQEEKILTDDNYKDMLLRYTQSIHCEKPIYEITNRSAKEFTIVVILFGERRGKGRNVKKKTAEQLAAKNAIDNLSLWNEIS